MTQTITFSEEATPERIAKVVAERAKLKPCCMRCRRNLPQKDLAAGRVCLDRSACTVRMIVRKPKINRFYSYPPRTLRRDF